MDRKVRNTDIGTEGFKRRPQTDNGGMREYSYLIHDPMIDKKENNYKDTLALFIQIV